MKFTAFHLMPYRPLDLDEAVKYRASWVVLPNSMYDPKKGADEYESYLSQLAYAEERISLHRCQPDLFPRALSRGA